MASRVGRFLGKSWVRTTAMFLVPLFVTMAAAAGVSPQPNDDEHWRFLQMVGGYLVALGAIAAMFRATVVLPVINEHILREHTAQMQMISDIKEELATIRQKLENQEKG